MDSVNLALCKQQQTRGGRDLLITLFARYTTKNSQAPMDELSFLSQSIYMTQA